MGVAPAGAVVGDILGIEIRGRSIDALHGLVKRNVFRLHDLGRDF
jgi:hypothetical protein